MENLCKSVAVVTGSNFGFATLKKLAESGITVVRLDIVTGNIERFIKEKNTLKIHVIECDVTIGRTR